MSTKQKRDKKRKERGKPYNAKQYAKSPVWRGRMMERVALNYLTNSKAVNNDMLTAPYDIEWMGLKIDVKSSKFYTNVPKQPGYYYWRGKKEGKEVADYFFCVGLMQDIPSHYYLMPKKEFGKRVKVNPFSRSKYDKWEVKDINSIRNLIKKLK